MSFILKKNIEAFAVVDGKFAGKTFKHGIKYSAIPEEEKRKFSKVKSKGAKKS